MMRRFYALALLLGIGLNALAQQPCGYWYVSPTGSGTLGTPSAPVTLTFALANITPQRNYIRMLGGSYPFTSKIVLPSNVTIEGGYQIVGGDWVLSSTVLTSLNINPPVETAVVAGTTVGHHIGIEASVVNGVSLHNLTINVLAAGATGNTGGRGNSVYGIYLNAATNYSISRCVVNAGSGAAGAAGSTPAGTGGGGAGGSGGSGGGQASGCNSDPGNGTAGGNGNSGASGGSGGPNPGHDGCNIFNCGQNPRSGNNGGAGTAGVLGAPTFVAGNQPAAPGVTQNFFVPAGASTAGGNGTGGGGGGGGSGAHLGSCCTCSCGSGNASGGTGGNGGNGGLGGAGGSGGGGSFAIYSFNSSGTVVDTDANAGAAGAGGLGGNGQQGGFATGGAAGGSHNRCGQFITGGTGGNGGNGGNGGRGQDGANGAAQNVVSIGGSVTQNGTTVPSNFGPITVNQYSGCTNSEITLTQSGGTLDLAAMGNAQLVNNLSATTTSYSTSSSPVGIYYTTNGTFDVVTSGTVYDNFIRINGTRTLPSISTSVNGTPTSSTCSGTPVTLSTSASGVAYEWVIISQGIISAPTGGAGTATTTHSFPSQGTYEVRLRVKDDCCGWSIPVFATMTIIGGPSVGYSDIQSPSACGANDGTITAIGFGGSAPYVFTWSNGFTGPVNPGLPAGPYVVTLTDAVGCQAQSTVSINDPNATPITFTASPGTTICDGDLVTFDASGGLFYQYFVNGVPTAAIDPWQTTTIQDGDLVSVLGVDTNLCSFTAPPIQFTVNPVPVLTPTSVDPTACQAADGEVGVSVSGGLAPYTYAWNTGGITPALTGLTAGFYFVTVTDGNNCSVSGTYGISDPNAAVVTLVSSEDPDNLICEGESVTFTASGSVNYDYYVDGVVVSTANPFTTTTLTDGQQVAVSGTDANGCVYADNANVREMDVNPGPIVTLISDAVNNTICVGQSLSFFAGGGITYEFFLNGTSQGAPSSTSLYVSSSLVDGDQVTVIATDQNGCDVASAAITVTVNPSPVANIVSQSDPTSCGAQDGSVEAGVSGGTSPYTYQWAAGPASTTYSGLSAGSYFVTVTDAAGCQSSISASLSDVGSSPVSVTNDATNNTTCGGTDVTFTATGAATYVFYVNGLVASTTNPFTTNTLADGDIVAVTGLDTQLCAATSAPVQFTVHPEIQISIISSINPSGCGLSDGSATTFTLGGVPAYSWLWSNGQTSPNLSNANAGQYLITVTDQNGCTASDAVSLSDVGAAVATITPDPSGTTICAGTEVTFTAAGSVSYEYFIDAVSVGTTNPYITSTLTDGQTVAVMATDANGCVYTTPGLTYTVNALPFTSFTSIDAVCLLDSSVTLTGGLPVGGVYSVDYVVNGFPITIIGDLFYPGQAGVGPHDVSYLYTSPTNGCVGVSTISVNVEQNPTVDLGPDQNICPQGTITLDAGAGFNSYAWSGSGTGTTQTLDITNTGVYTVTVTDATGCEGTDDIAIGINAPVLPIITPSGPTNICQGQSVDLSAQANFTNYQWSNGFVGQTLSATQTGSYSVTVTDNLGCQGTSLPIDVIVSSLPNASISSNGPLNICQGNSVTLFGAAGFANYVWSDGVNGQSNTVSTAGSYTLTVTAANGCTNTTPNPAVVTVNAGPDPVISPPGPISFCKGDYVVLDAGAGYASYLWTTGSTTQLVTITESGNYGVTVMDAFGCTDSVAVSSQVVVTVFAPTPVVDQYPDSLAVVNASQFVSFQWFQDGNPIPGATNPYLAITVDGVYTVQVTDTNDCTGMSPDFNMDCCVGIATIEGIESLEIFPIPSHGEVIIDFVLNAAKDVTLCVRDLTGRAIAPPKTLKGSGQVHATVDLTDVPAGVYMLELEIDGAKLTRRIARN
jgi:hypothetical protein